MNEVAREPLRLLTIFDWVFVIFAWATAWYLFGNIFEWIQGNRGDPMPVIAGVPIVIVGWLALRLGIRLQNAVNRLDDGAGLANANAVSIQAFHDDLGNTVRWWSIVVGAIVSVVLAIVYWIIIFCGLLPWDPIGGSVLAIAMIGPGFAVGLLLGRLIAYGSLTAILERHRIRLAGLTTRQAKLAMRGVEHVFEFSVFSTTTCCLWFAFWWVMWNLGHLLNYWPWRVAFLPLWLVSFFVFIFGARRPARAFHRRLDELYGGAKARQALDQQLSEAREDLAKLVSVHGDIKFRAEAEELDTFIKELAARRFRSPLLDPKLLDAIVLLNILLLIVPWQFGGWIRRLIN